MKKQRDLESSIQHRSNTVNFKIDKLTDGWNLSPPLYGPIAELNSTLKPLLTWGSPESEIQGTLNWITLSGSTILSRIFAFLYLGFDSMKGITVSTTSSTAWMNSGSWLFFNSNSFIKELIWCWYSDILQCVF